MSEKPIVFIAFLVLSQVALAEIYTGRGFSIADGDTFTVIDAENARHKLRRSCTDIPEKNPPFGNDSRQNLTRVVFQKQVTIKLERLNCFQRDVGKVLVGGQDANLEQIEAGLA